MLPTKPNALVQSVTLIRGHLLVLAKVCAGAISECGISKRKDRMSRSKKEQGGASWFPAIEFKIEKNLCANIGKLRLALFCCATCASGFPQSRTETWPFSSAAPTRAIGWFGQEKGRAKRRALDQNQRAAFQNGQIEFC
jgi:hypothetical protein